MTRSPNNLTWNEAMTSALQRTATVWLPAHASSPLLVPDGHSGSASGRDADSGWSAPAKRSRPAGPSDHEYTYTSSSGKLLAAIQSEPAQSVRSSDHFWKQCARTPRSPTSDGTGPEICKRFNDSRGCRFDQKCVFRHVCDKNIRTSSQGAIANATQKWWPRQRCRCSSCTQTCR